MTVAELIEKLQRCPQDAEVFTSDAESGHWDDPGAYLVDAWFGATHPGGRQEVHTTGWELKSQGPNCKAVVISRFGEDGEQL
jgi:hypothetical protein